MEQENREPSAPLDPFDPLGDLVVAQFARPAEYDAVNLRVLSPFQRVLLAADGTVTKLIEAFIMEPLRILPLGQTTISLPETHAWLEAPEGTAVARRQVMIEGEFSHDLFVYATSLVVHDRLPPEVGDRLTGDGEGIGRVLNEHKIETRREILWYGREHVQHLPDAVRDRTNGEFLSRVYRIICRGKPVALIKERFPSEIERLHSPH